LGLPPDAATTAEVGPRPPLVVALARVHKWQKMIESGEYASLAPDIVEDILRGDEPEGIGLNKLHKDLPVCWKQQRRTWASMSSPDNQVKEWVADRPADTDNRYIATGRPAHASRYRRDQELSFTQRS